MRPLPDSRRGSRHTKKHEKLQAACAGAEVGKGLAVRGNDCQNAQEKVKENVNSWLSELGF